MGRRLFHNKQAGAKLSERVSHPDGTETIRKVLYRATKSERVSHLDGIKMEIKVLGNGKC